MTGYDDSAINSVMVIIIIIIIIIIIRAQQCFDAVGWAAGRASGL